MLKPVSIRLNASAGQRMLDFATENVGRGTAVVFIEPPPETRIIDGKKVRNPRITEEVISIADILGVFDSRIQTTGLSSSQEASKLVLLLRVGSLAAPVDSERIIGPRLGRENIENGWRLVDFSFLFVLIFVNVYYRVFSLITAPKAPTNQPTQ